MRPACRLESVVDGGRKGRLGRQPVADIEDDGGRRVGERAADRVVGFDGAEQPAASVEVDDERPDARRRIRPADRNVRQSRPGEWRSSARPRHRRARPGRSPANSDSKLTRASATGSRCALGRPDAATSSSSFLATGSSATGAIVPGPASRQGSGLHDGVRPHAGVGPARCGSDPVRQNPGAVLGCDRVWADHHRVGDRDDLVHR